MAGIQIARNLRFELVRGITVAVADDDLVTGIEARAAPLRQLQAAVLAGPDHPCQYQVAGTRDLLPGQQCLHLPEWYPPHRIGDLAAPQAVIVQWFGQWRVNPGDDACRGILF